MVFISSTDELVIGSIHQIPDILNLSGNVIYEFLWCDTCFLGFQLDFLTMLICSGLEKYVIALLSLVAGNGICQYDFIGVADVRLTGCIRNGCCDIILWFFHGSISSH